MDTTLSVSYETIAHFFEATEGNYRNAMYISCSCSYRRAVLLPLADAENFLGTRIDRTDCAAVVSSSCFIRLYHQWILLSTPSSSDCPIQQLLHLLNRPGNGK